MNVVTLIGNLATEVELRELSDGKKVASFLLAVDRASREGGADFVRVSAWERQAELCSEYLARGRRIALDGRLRSRSWEEDGKRRSAVEVVAHRIEFLGGGAPDEGPAGSAVGKADDARLEDRSAHGAPGAEVIPFEPAAAG
jgi:single-strand DNA-binding protein